jgi:hypothetical protein
VFDGGVLGGNLTVVIGSVRWTGNLPDRDDVEARGGAKAARGKRQQLLAARGGAWRFR